MGVHWAVKDVDFRLHPGESLGIIGPNGAGKTTILKLLSKVTYPTQGNIRVNGSFSALIELGAGFHPELTGRENIFLNGTILGMRRPEIKASFDRIVDFAGIGEYLDTPVKRYSSGMYARLGFAIAAHVNPDVLLVDEVLAVGDYAFRAKCYQLMDELRARGTTLIFVSHNMEDVRRVCDRGIVLFRGKIAFDGSADRAVVEYANVLRENASKEEKKLSGIGEGLSQRRMTHAAKIDRAVLVGEDGVEKQTVRSGETVYLAADIHFEDDAESPIFALSIRADNGEVVYDTTTRLLGIQTPHFSAGDRIRVKYRFEAHLLDGIYKITTDLAYADLSCYFDYYADAVSFLVIQGDKATGMANLNAVIAIEIPNYQNPTENYSPARYQPVDNH